MDAIVHLGVRASQGQGQERRAGLIKLYGVFGSAVSGISASLTRVLARVACFEGRPRLTLPGKICNPISRDQTERHAQTGRHADIKAHIMPGKIEHLAIRAKPLLCSFSDGCVSNGWPDCACCKSLLVAPASPCRQSARASLQGHNLPESIMNSALERSQTRREIVFDLFCLLLYHFLLCMRRPEWPSGGLVLNEAAGACT